MDVFVMLRENGSDSYMDTFPKSIELGLKINSELVNCKTVSDRTIEFHET
jgi:hypothetical protein